jgi:hypothetical protein
MNLSKKEAVDFCMNAYVKNKKVDIWLTIILTIGLAILIFPILIWLIYRYANAKKKMDRLKVELVNNPSLYDTIFIGYGVGYTRTGAEVENTLVIEINNQRIDIPNLYFWLSSHSKSEIVQALLNDN